MSKSLDEYKRLILRRFLASKRKILKQREAHKVKSGKPPDKHRGRLYERALDELVKKDRWLIRRSGHGKVFYGINKKCLKNILKFMKNMA